mmetsp:Transcript_9110/g.20267  ORF Transcript_9110/g.20267 Transcript_9110/m.20267 type:complete len:214 (-) Transcript_9110:137-778(-)
MSIPPLCNRATQQSSLMEKALKKRHSAISTAGTSCCAFTASRSIGRRLSACKLRLCRVLFASSAKQVSPSSKISRAPCFLSSKVTTEATVPALLINESDSSTTPMHARTSNSALTNRVSLPASGEFVSRRKRLVMDVTNPDCKNCESVAGSLPMIFVINRNTAKTDLSSSFSSFVRSHIHNEDASDWSTSISTAVSSFCRVCSACSMWRTNAS